jgi:protein TonB
MASTTPDLVDIPEAPAEQPRGAENRVPAREPDLAIHTLDELVSDVRRTRGPLGTVVSILAHVALVAAVVAVPLLMDAPLPEADGAVRAFFATPLELAPPPPPPPPPAPAARPAVKAAAPPVERADGFVAPVEVPAEIVPEAGLDLGVEGGVAGGVEGGVPGGVVGGVIGGLPEAPPPAPKLPPVRVGGRVKEPTKLKAVPPVYPDAAVNARIEGVVILECLISPQGRVSEVRVLRSVPLLEQAAVDAVRQWVYTPTLMDGVPVPVLMTVTVRFDLK